MYGFEVSEVVFFTAHQADEAPTTRSCSFKRIIFKNVRVYFADKQTPKVITSPSVKTDYPALIRNNAVMSAVITSANEFQGLIVKLSVKAEN